MRVIVDTDLSLGDPGSEVDDGLALAMVVADPAFSLEAVTTVSGNVDAAGAASLTLDLLERLGVSGVPVYAGARSPLCDPTARRPAVPGVPDGGDPRVRLGYAAAELARRVVEAPGEITVVAIGPLTNVATAITLDARFAGAVKEIVVMGGTYFQDLSWGSLPGEFNFWLDPEAVRVVLRSGARVRLVGLDVTTQVPLSLADAQGLQEAGGQFAPYAGACAQAWIERLAREYPADPLTGDSCSMHDPLAVAAAARPDLLTWRDVYVDIVTHDQVGRGIAVVDRLDPPNELSANCSLAVSVDTKAVRAYVLGLLAGL
jgi:purine nucleosidase